VYNPNQQRVRHTDSNGRSTLYIGSLYEFVNQGGVSQQINRVGDNVQFIVKSGSTNSLYHEYLHRDHIGSIVATSGETLTSSADVKWQANGACVEKIKFDKTKTIIYISRL
jgi:hypothetical protein